MPGTPVKQEVRDRGHAYTGRRAQRQQQGNGRRARNQQSQQVKVHQVRGETAARSAERIFEDDALGRHQAHRGINGCTGQAGG